VRARGSFLKTDVRQSILVIAVRRPNRGIFTVLAFRSARTGASRYAPEPNGLYKRSERGGKASCVRQAEGVGRQDQGFYLTADA
jgi:hypothetical protein